MIQSLHLYRSNKLFQKIAFDEKTEKPVQNYVNHLLTLTLQICKPKSIPYVSKELKHQISNNTRNFAFYEFYASTEKLAFQEHLFIIKIMHPTTHIILWKWQKFVNDFCNSEKITHSQLNMSTFD